MFVAYLWGIETHKKNKSVVADIEFVAYLWGIETAHAFSVVYFGGDVCSLPMRDWNEWEISERFGSFLQFVAYLWGIETALQQT